MKRTLFAVMLLAACGGDDEPDTAQRQAEFRAWQDAYNAWGKNTQDKATCAAECRPMFGEQDLSTADTTDKLVYCGKTTFPTTCDQCAAMCPDGSELLSAYPEANNPYPSVVCGGSRNGQGESPSCQYSGPDPGPEPKIEDYVSQATHVEGSWAE